jgi:hypothetical protein
MQSDAPSRACDSCSFRLQRRETLVYDRPSGEYLMSEAPTLATYLEELAGLTDADALARVPHAALVQASYEPIEQQRGFHTAYLDRSIETHASVDPEKREVFWLRKRGDGVFGGHISVGRTQNLDIAIPRAGISKFHAFFSRDAEGRYCLTDKESKNGTFVGGLRLTPGVSQVVRDGDEVRFGGHAFLFMEPASFVRFISSFPRRKR